ncbi:uncharacterized protein LOC132699976 [Cylas formicarius]|uniref:uncharacterized protein LOC132699976 n=1 Tax=Cylas formicarius TaxID=197179 RepID=UPI002958B487|nr:uncharacterized protein LOC132699976 [Cylas formicarius]XP_060522977.1 uncharacterized protein LOC132699976 [Cylas formicarius]
MGSCEDYLLKRCCCCGSLRTGTLFAGFASVILSIFTILVIVLKMLDIINVELRMIILDSFLSEFAIEIILIVNLCVTIILSILLIVGTIKRNFYIMMPWVVLGGMLIIGLLVSVLITSINFYTSDDSFNGTLWLVIGLIAFVLYSYMWYVAFSFFYQIYQEARRGAYTKDPFRRKY